MFSRKLKAGDVVRIRTREEILSTLDADGCLEGMPIMPEMLRFCGMTMRVAARAHKTCDTVNNTGGSRVEDAVHLDGARCDGSAHGECQADCRIYWKTAWVERASNATLDHDSRSLEIEHAELPREWSYKTAPDTAEAEAIYRCQATELPSFVRPMQWWDIRQYIEDLTSRNIGIRKLFRGMWHSLSHAILTAGIGYRAWKAFYNRLHHVFGIAPFYWVNGRLSRTPTSRLDLKPNEWVRIKPLDEIVKTLDTSNKNRGMGFDPAEMGLYCERIAQVDQPVYRFINDRTGKMVVLKEPTVRLKGIYCTGERSNVRKFCPRAIAPYWREIWLERADEPSQESKTLA